MLELGDRYLSQYHVLHASSWGQWGPSTGTKFKRQHLSNSDTLGFTDISRLPILSSACAFRAATCRTAIVINGCKRTLLQLRYRYSTNNRIDILHGLSAPAGGGFGCRGRKPNQAAYVNTRMPCVLATRQRTIIICGYTNTPVPDQQPPKGAYAIVLSLLYQYPRWDIPFCDRFYGVAKAQEHGHPL